MAWGICGFMGNWGVSSAALEHPHLSAGFLWPGRGGGRRDQVAPRSEQGWPQSGAPALGSCGVPWGGCCVLALPGHSLAAPRSEAHGGVQPCSCPLCNYSPLLLPGLQFSRVLPPPVPLSPPSWCHSPSTASTRPVSGLGRRKGSLFPLC